MIEVPLTKGKIALIDDADADEILSRKWTAITNGRGSWYAYRVYFENGVRKHIRMHRQLLRAPAGVDVDHQDGNGLNNQRSNLRLCTHRQNSQNRKLISTVNSSGFKGVSFDKKKQQWRADIRINGKLVCLGWFREAKSAADAYDIAAYEHFGDFAKPNSA